MEVVRTPVVGRARARRAPARPGPAPSWSRARRPRPRRSGVRRGARAPAAIPPCGLPTPTSCCCARSRTPNVDVLITTGSTAPGPDNHLRSVLRDLNARWLVDGVSVTPGAQMLLARLPDGRFLVGLPGDPTAALAGLVTLASPLIRALRDEPVVGHRRSAVLMDDTPPADYADDTALVPVLVEVSAAATQARPLPATGPGGPGGLGVGPTPSRSCRRAPDFGATSSTSSTPMAGTCGPAGQHRGHSGTFPVW